MLSFPGSVKILLAVEPVDMRKSFNGLYNVGYRAPERKSDSGWSICFLQQAAQSVENPILGRYGIVGTGKTFGGRTLQLAEGHRCEGRKIKPQTCGFVHADRGN